MNSNNFIFDSAFISTSEDFECSMITPVAVPWVVHKPVVFSIFSSPPNDFNGMTTKYLTSGMLVYSWFVWWEVWVDSESSFDWTVCHNILLNRGNIIWNRVSLVAKGLVFLVSMSSISFLGCLKCFRAHIILVLKNGRNPTWNACGSTSWSRSITSTWRTIARDMMFAWLEWIWFACGGIAIESTSWKTSGCDVVHGGKWESTITACTTWVAAWS